MKNNRFIEGRKDNEIKFLAEEVAKEIQKGLRTLTIISPYRLNQVEIDLLLRYLPSIFVRGAKVENLIDRSLIAGVVAIYHSRVIDLSLKGRLKNLQIELSSGL